MLTKIYKEPFASTITVDELQDICHTLMTVAAGSSEMLVYVYQNTEHHTVEDSSLQPQAWKFQILKREVLHSPGDKIKIEMKFRDLQLSPGVPHILKLLCIKRQGKGSNIYFRHQYS